MEAEIYQMQYYPNGRSISMAPGWHIRKSGAPQPYVLAETQQAAIEAFAAKIKQVRTPVLLRVSDESGMWVQDIKYNH